ncbi:hypothetical protein ACFQE8_14230 [Salinirubellus sp. GCM10025818]|uniref:hypothetical protein n=1 Tax=Salinirubellus TaxID=2162630 RepID=UPI0030D4C2FE
MAKMSYTDKDVGKHVVNADGDRVGTVTAVRHGTADVDPNPDTFDLIEVELGREDADEDTDPSKEGEVSEVPADEIRPPPIPRGTDTPVPFRVRSSRSLPVRGDLRRPEFPLRDGRRLIPGSRESRIQPPEGRNRGLPQKALILGPKTPLART